MDNQAVFIICGLICALTAFGWYRVGRRRWGTGVLRRLFVRGQSGHFAPGDTEKRGFGSFVDRMVVALVAAIVALSSISVEAAPLWRVTIDGVTVSEELGPIATTSGFIVPIEFAALWGAGVSRDGSSYMVVHGEQWVVLQSGVKWATSHLGTRSLAVPPVLIGSTFYVPLQIFSEFFDLKLKWNWNTGALDIGQWTAFDAGRNNQSVLVGTIQDALQLIDDVRGDVAGEVSRRDAADVLSELGSGTDSNGIPADAAAALARLLEEESGSHNDATAATSGTSIQWRQGSDEVRESSLAIAEAIERLTQGRGGASSAGGTSAGFSASSTPSASGGRLPMSSSTTPGTPTSPVVGEATGQRPDEPTTVTNRNVQAPSSGDDRSASEEKGAGRPSGGPVVRLNGTLTVATPRDGDNVTADSERGGDTAVAHAPQAAEQDHAIGQPSAVPIPLTGEEHLRWHALADATGAQVTVRDDEGLVIVEVDAPGQSVAAQTSLLVDPYRLLIDVHGVTAADTGVGPFELTHGTVHRLRSGEHENGLRLIVDLKHAVGHAIDDAMAEQGRLRVVLFRPVTDVEWDQWETGGRAMLHVHPDTPFEVHRLPDPERWIIDLQQTTKSTVRDEWLASLAGSPVSRVRVAQNMPTTTRIVLDMDGPLPVRVVKEVSGIALYYGDDRSAQIAYRAIGDDELRLRIRVDADEPMRTARLTSPDRLVFDIEGKVLDETIPSQTFAQGPVSQLRVSQFDGTTVRIVADLRHHVQYVVHRGENLTEIVLRRPPLTGRRIVVDAGHGGMDGGAVGRNLGVVEKDVNLTVALKLAQLLRDAGAQVYLTRKDDSFHDLWSRPELANSVGADVFVSIHSNSAEVTSSTANGTEVYVDMADKERLRLGESLQESLVSAIGTRDRGVRQNKYLVVRQSTMPAALVEVGFLSDEAEEKLMAETWFRHRAAEGIFNGLLRYFHPSDELPLNTPSSKEESKSSWTSLLERGTDPQ